MSEHIDREQEALEESLLGEDWLEQIRAQIDVLDHMLSGEVLPEKYKVIHKKAVDVLAIVSNCPSDLVSGRVRHDLLGLLNIFEQRAEYLEDEMTLNALRNFFTTLKDKFDKIVAVYTDPDHIHLEYMNIAERIKKEIPGVFTIALEIQHEERVRSEKTRMGVEWTYDITKDGVVRYVIFTIKGAESAYAWTDEKIFLVGLENIARNAVLHNQDFIGILHIELEVLDHRNRVIVHFKDNGTGVENPGSVFKTGFTTGGGDHQGLGLGGLDERFQSVGASITVEAHGGINGGACFTLTLPKDLSSQ